MTKIKKVKKFYEDFDSDNWNDHFESDPKRSIKFNKDECRCSPTFQIMTYNKTHGEDCETPWIINRKNVFVMPIEKHESYKDLTFLMYKALKIMRENPELDVKIVLVSWDAYDYDDTNGNWWPADYLEEVEDDK